MEPGISSPYPMVSVQSAIQVITSTFANKKYQSVIPLARSLNRTLSRTIYSPMDFPQIPTSVMDGYAVLSSDTPAALEVKSAVRAGDVPVELKSGETVYVTTGSPVPEGADAVVPIERCTREGEKVAVP